MSARGGGNWLIRYRPPQEKDFHPDWQASELSRFEVEPYEAMFYRQSKVEQPKKKKAVWRTFDHGSIPPKDM
eukprot:806326-Prorocentrum_lima.AAC.1